MHRSTTMRGISTISFYAADLEAAKQWYTEFLGIPPYFEVPGYLEFRVGDYQHELGIIDRRYAPEGKSDQPAGSVTYWHVDQLEHTLERLISLGAKEYQPIRVLTKGFVIASVVDPFGNILGIMSNPHYLEILASKNNVRI